MQIGPKNGHRVDAHYTTASLVSTMKHAKWKVFNFSVTMATAPFIAMATDLYFPGDSCHGVNKIVGIWSTQQTPHHRYLRRSVHVVLVLQQQRCCFDVVFLGGDVERRQSNTAPGIVFQQDSHHFLVSLLQSHSHWREAILENQTTDLVNLGFLS